MDKIIKSDNKEILRLHNNFINAIFSLSTDAKKLLLVIWLHTNHSGENIKIYRADILEKVGIDLKNLNPEHREKIIEELMKTIITIRDIKNPNNFTKMQLVYKTKYKDGVLYTNLDEDLLVYIREAQEKLFTRFKIQNIKPLTSSNAIRIYLLLKQYDDTGWREIGINEFKKMLELENKYKRMYDFKKYVLEVAKKQINKNTDIEIDYEIVKQGRKAIKIRFLIKNKTKKEKELSSNKKVRVKNDLNSFRLDLLKKGNVILQLNDEVYEIKDNLLYQNDKILDRTTSFEIWNYLYKNKEQLKIINNKEEFKQAQIKQKREKIKEEILKTYLGKTIEVFIKNEIGKHEKHYCKILQIEDITYKENGDIDYILIKGEDKDSKTNYKIKITLEMLRDYTSKK